MKPVNTILLALLIGGALASCIGTDVIDDLEATVPPTEPVPVDTTSTDTTGVAERQGTLRGQGGYTATGTVTLGRNEAGDVILATSADFRVSFALGTSLYLSNSLEGGATASGGLEVADVSDTPTGQQSFNVSRVDPNATLTTYQYVIVLCKPARLTFGSAELN